MKYGIIYNRIIYTKILNTYRKPQLLRMIRLKFVTIQVRCTCLKIDQNTSEISENSMQVIKGECHECTCQIISRLFPKP